MSDPWICDDCGARLEIGDYPICRGDPAKHQKVPSYKPFPAFFDIAMGAQVSSLADWNRKMKENKLDLRSKYDPTPISQEESGRRLRKPMPKLRSFLYPLTTSAYTRYYVKE